MPRSTLRTGVKPLPPLTTWPNDPPGQWPTWPPGPMHHMAHSQLAHDPPGARVMAMAHLPASCSMWPIALLTTWPPGYLFYSLFYSCFCCLWPTWPLAYYGHYAHYAYRPKKQALQYKIFLRPLKHIIFRVDNKTGQDREVGPGNLLNSKFQNEDKLQGVSRNWTPGKFG